MKEVWAISNDKGQIVTLCCQDEGCSRRWPLDPPVTPPTLIVSKCPDGHRFEAKAVCWGES